MVFEETYQGQVFIIHGFVDHAKWDVVDYRDYLLFVNIVNNISSSHHKLHKKDFAKREIYC